MQPLGNDLIKICKILEPYPAFSCKFFSIEMEIGWFINHSNTPNVAITSGTAGNYFIITTCDIKAGDEILMDYNQLDEPEHLKEPYYHPQN